MTKRDSLYAFVLAALGLIACAVLAGLGKTVPSIVGDVTLGAAFAGAGLGTPPLPRLLEPGPAAEPPVSPVGVPTPDTAPPRVTVPDAAPAGEVDPQRVAFNTGDPLAPMVVTAVPEQGPVAP